MRIAICCLTGFVLCSSVGCGPSHKPPATGSAAERAAFVAAASARSVANAPPKASASPSAPEPPGLAVSSSEALAPGARIADLTAARLAGRMLLAWVTYVDQVPDQGKKGTPSAGRAASVVVRALDDRGEPARPAAVISSRADSVGGVAIAADASGADAGLAWTGVDQGRTQVFLTRVGPDGQKKAQRMVSHGKGAASDVAVAGTADGWVVAWVETREKEVEVHAATVSAKLDKVGIDRVVTSHQGDASEVRILVRGDAVLLAWADARAGQGSSDLYTARLAASDLGWRGDEVRLSSKPDHARGVRLAARGDDALIAWIERPAESPAAPTPPAALIARLDASGRLRASPMRIPLAIAAGSIGIGCDRAACKVALASTGGDALDLSGLVWDASGPIPRPRKIASFDRVATEDVSLNVVGEWLFFAEDNLKGAGRIRRLRVGWE
jgi:hypothetical protein